VQGATVQLRMTTEKLKEAEFEREILEQRLLKVLVTTAPHLLGYKQA